MKGAHSAAGWTTLVLVGLVSWLPRAHVSTSGRGNRARRAGRRHPRQAQDARTEADLRRAVADAERFGPADPRLATSLNALAVFYASHGRPAQAEPLYPRALEIRERALGRDQPRRDREPEQPGGALCARATLHGGGDRSTSGPSRSTSGSTGKDAASTGIILKNLANLDISQGNYGKAEPGVPEAGRSSGRRRSGRGIPISRSSSTIWASSIASRGSTPKPSGSTGARRLFETRGRRARTRSSRSS